MYPIDIITLSGTAELRETDSAELVWLVIIHHQPVTAGVPWLEMSIDVLVDSAVTAGRS